MKKRIILAIFISFLMIGKVSAADVDVNGTSSVTVGNTINVTVTFSADSPLASIEGTVEYSSSMLQFVGGDDLAINIDDSSNSLKSKILRYTFKAISSGNATVKVVNPRYTEMTSNGWLYLKTSSLNINIAPQKVVTPHKYSSNNNLKSLSIEGFELTPKFNNETLEYNIELPAKTESINILAEKEDSLATITGNGIVNVIEGLNKIEVGVTAENGNIKTFIINATVKEVDPIIVKVDNKKYTLVRKKEALIIPNKLYLESTIRINNEDIPCFVNDKIKYTLVGLKDEFSNINLYKYEEGNYSLYKEINSGSIIITPIENNNKLYSYESYKISVNKIEFDVLKSNKANKFSIIYGLNIDNGNTNYYVYDEVEKTLQRLNMEEIDSLNQEIIKKQYIIYGLLGVIVIIMALLLINISKKDKKIKKNKVKDIEKIVDDKVIVKDDMIKLEDTIKFNIDNIKALKKK